MGQVSTGSTSINFGSNLRIGYRIAFSSSAFTYLNQFPTLDELPYTFNLDPGTYEIEYTQVCPNCSGNKYSEPDIVVVTVSS